ncbi:cucumisin-like [Panicum miliaceum]|uniref:Cucumisin-like n=1 Tax=Panicum miliaceum TaxID=4540 RepID=A0A3L6QIX0_PANMI|nr:cucumisin-like [Panicum miliaceum]
MTTRLHLALLVLLSSSILVSSIRRASDNNSPLAAYLVTVRRPDGLLSADEPDASEMWHTYLLGQVCNTSDPATAERFPTAESRLIYSYSHVVSGFSAWLTPQEVDDMAWFPWFVEAVPDKSYKLMSADTPTPELSWLDGVRDGVWNKGNMGEGITIGVLDAGIAAGNLPASPDAEGMPSPPAKWKGSCENSEACNNKLIGLRTFVDTSRALGAAMFIGEVGNMAQPSSGEVGSFMQRASVLGIEYDKAFEVAPKAHLAIYRVCNEGCHPAAVNAGMVAAVDDGVDVVSMCVGTKDNAVFHDVDVTAPSYKAFARGVLVCAPAGSSGPDMFKVESSAPWLLTVAASDIDHRVVTNVELGNGILKPDVSAPGADTLAESPHGGKYTDAQIKAATSMAAAHVTGVAALIKKAHYEWSPAAIKSALVTTADPVGPGDALVGEGASYFVTGAGEVNPVKALDPGLVYDLTAGDFIPYLCGKSLGEDQTRQIVETAGASCAETGEVAAKDMNYPSIMIVMGDGAQQVEAKRTATNVGEPAETYRAEVTAHGVDVAVNPSTMVFSDIGQQRDFVVTVRRQASTPAKSVIEGELKWVSEKHAVRSPMVVVVGETVASSAGHSYGADVASIES